MTNTVEPITDEERRSRIKWADDIDFTKADLEARTHARTIYKYEARLSAAEEENKKLREENKRLQEILQPAFGR